ncbi:hypothetical protein QZH41_001476 [Actinostola sp. cb2023]|nr:hypothetical protein QZH41_001476 [Actinostola sp. cb2023]
MKEGDIFLQGLFPITYRDGEKCDRLYKDGVMWAMAMLFAIESINNSTLLSNLTLGYKIDNTCQHIPTAMHNAIEIVAKYRPNSICYPHRDYCEGGSKGEQKIAAVIGPAMSWIAIPIASLLGLYEIPQISYAATSRILSDKTRYNSFMRTVPSDEYQAKAMAKFVHDFGWNYVFIIASDDDYGKMGAATFKATAKGLNVCIANDEYIPFKSDMAAEYLHNTLLTLKNSERSKVVIVFSYGNQGEILLKEAAKLNITGRTWITSDAWTSSVIGFNLSHNLLEGIITFSIRSQRVDEFVDFVNHLQIKDVQHIPWFRRYMENVLDCVSTNDTGRGRRLCDPNETLPSHHDIPNEAIANVIDAVNATANAIKTMFSCAPGKECRNPNLPITPLELLQQIKNTSFVGADSANVEFNANGDRTSSGYTIRNVQVQHGKLVYVDVGYWSQIKGKTHFEVNSSLIKWNSGRRPRSNCFRVCQPGERVVGQTECCWNCQKCEKGTFSSSAGALTCTKCNETHYTDEQRTTCIARKVVYLSLRDPAGISILTVCMLGVVTTSVIAGIFVHFRNTPVIASSTAFHLVMFFVILYMSFFFAMSITVSKPSNTMCVVIESMYELLIMMYTSFLLSKTRIVNKIVRSAVSRLKYMRPEWSHILVVASLMTLQLILVTVRQSISPSYIQFVNQEDKTRLLQCKQVFSSLKVLPIAFPSAILIVATLISFKERNIPDNFNEAKFISFTTILLCIIFISFISTYRYVTGISRILVLTFTAFVAAFSGMGCIFIPKLYVIFIRPERNTHRESTCTDSYAASEQQNQSARTSVSEGPSPDLNSNVKSAPRTTNKLHLLEVQNSGFNHVTSFLNYGSESSDESPQSSNHVTDPTNHVQGNESTNQLQGKHQANGRKKSKSHVTFELSTLTETAEDTWPIPKEQYSNLGCSEDEDIGTGYDAVDISSTPRAFTVI